MRINITCPRSVGRKAAPSDSIGPPPGEPIVEAGALRPCSRRLVLYRDWPPIRGRTIVLHRDRVEAPYRGLWAPSVPVHAFRAAIFGDAEFRLRINLSTPRSSVLARSRNDRSGHSDIAMWLYCLRMRCDAGRKHHPGEGDKRAEGVHHGRSPSAGVGGPEGLVPLSRAETDSRFKDRLINDPGLWQHIDVACRNQDRAGGGGGSALDRHEGKRAVPSCSFGARSGIFSQHAACPCEPFGWARRPRFRERRRCHAIAGRRASPAESHRGRRRKVIGASLRSRANPRLPLSRASGETPRNSRGALERGVLKCLAKRASLRGTV